MAYIKNIPNSGPAWFVRLILSIALYVGILGISSSQAQPADDLFAALKSSKTGMEARQIERQIWEGWIGNAPTPDLEASVRGAMTKRRYGDYDGALADLDQVIEAAPDYAEAWNQRAFLLYLQEKPEAALQAIEIVLELEPRHFGALSGKFRILIAQGRARVAQDVLREAVAIHPFLPERIYLQSDPENDGLEL